MTYPDLRLAKGLANITNAETTVHREGWLECAAEYSQVDWMHKQKRPGQNYSACEHRNVSVYMSDDQTDVIRRRQVLELSKILKQLLL